MERLLKPAVFDTDHNAPDATKQWKHFFKTFQNFANVVNDDPNRLQLLQVHVSPDVYQLIEESQTYEQAIAALKRLHVKTPNFTSWVRRQKEGESLDSFLQSLKDLS